MIVFHLFQPLPDVTPSYSFSKESFFLVQSSLFIFHKTSNAIFNDSIHTLHSLDFVTDKLHKPV